MEIVYTLIKEIEKYHAHVAEDKEKEITRRELLTEHIDCTMKYFEELAREKQLDKMLERFVRQMFGELSMEGIQFLREMIRGIPLFHDMGKINPDFQKQAMHNQQIAKNNMFWHIGKFENDRLRVAKAIVRGIGINIYEVLYHYYKHEKKDVKPTIDWIKKEFYQDVKDADNIKVLMSAEGELWMRFYGCFKYFLPEDFIMNKRVKRPPDNPINAMISFGNTLLYTKTISAIFRTHLDERISFLHEPSEGRFSLSLDISEVFKPVIVYRTIFDLVNNRKIQVSKHFEKKVNYCLLNEEGRKVFIEAFEGRLESVFQHPVLKRKVTYRTAIKLDCYKLIKEIMEDKEFVPFSLKEGY